jgi:hypothetical protein
MIRFKLYPLPLYSSIVLLSFQTSANCISTIVTDGSETWSRLYCTSSNWFSLQKYLYRDTTLASSTGRPSDGDLKFKSLTKQQQCATIAAHEPPNCNSPKDIEPNGCTLSPDTYGEASFLHACNLHDLCYTSIGSSQQSCDAGLYQEMINACEAAYGPRQIEGSRIPGANGPNVRRLTCDQFGATTYFQAVESFGSLYHKQAQSDAICNDFLKMVEDFCE